MKNKGGGEIPINDKLKLSRNYLKTIVKYMKENSVKYYNYEGIQVELSDTQLNSVDLPTSVIDKKNEELKKKEVKKFQDFETEQDKFYDTKKWDK